MLDIKKALESLKSIREYLLKIEVYEYDRKQGIDRIRQELERRKKTK